MRPSRVFRVSIGAAMVSAAAFGACVGDEANVTTSNADGGVDSGAANVDSSVADSATDTATTDTGVDAPEGPRCDPGKPFGAPTLLPGAINTPDHEAGFTMSSDELVAVVSRLANAGKSELRYVTRASKAVPFGAADFDKVGNVNKSEDYENAPALGADGLTLYFHRSVVATTSELIVFSTRGTRNDPFATDQVIFVDAVALPHGVSPKISRDGLDLYWTDIDGENLFVATRTTGAGAFGPKQIIGAGIGSPVLTKDELTLYYSDINSGGVMKYKTRSAKNAPFGAAQDLPASVTDSAYPVHVSDDGCILYIASNRVAAGAPGGFDIYEVKRPL